MRVSKGSPQIDGLYIPVWIDLLMKIDTEKTYRSKSHLCKDLNMTFKHTSEILCILQKKDIIICGTRQGIKTIPIRLTDRGQELRKLLLFVYNYLK